MQLVTPQANKKVKPENWVQKENQVYMKYSRK